jgi:hypothetical protein
MATQTLTRPNFGFGIVRTLGNIGQLFVSIAAAQQAAADYERMSNRTDAELASKGLRREGISRVVYEHYFD